MKTKFVCEKCGNFFNSENECKEHEEYCQKNVPIKGIFIYYFDENNIEIKIMEYPSAILFGKDKIKLNANSYHHIPGDINLLHLDKIWKYDCINGIFTTNFDEKYEKECINKLIEKIKEDFEDDIKEYMELIEKKRTVLKNKNYKIERDKDCHQVVSGDIYDWFINE